jgi:hypothetical protein
MRIVVRDNFSQPPSAVGAIIKILKAIMAGIAGSLLKTQAVTAECLFLSLNEARLGDERLHASGILRNFLLLQEPDLKHYKTGEVTANGRLHA